jgi:selenocysteine lyase/cysteine desulfurase
VPRRSPVRDGWVCAELLKRGPGAGVRISTHFYNIDEEIDAAFAAVDDILHAMVPDSSAASG